MGIDLPKDATGREIPLDTETLYGEDGKCFEVNHFAYCVRQTIPSRKWEVVLMSCMVEPCTTFYLTPPEPPDSWKKLDEDLDRCIRADSLCPYNSTEECSACVLPMETQNHCNSIALKEIKERIRKLRGED